MLSKLHPSDCESLSCFLCTQTNRRRGLRRLLMLPSTDELGTARRHMFVPLLRRVSAVLPTLLPAAWIDAPPPTPDSYNSTVERQYALACQGVNGPSHDFNDLQTDLVNLLSSVKLKSGGLEAVHALPRQLEYLLGADDVLEETMHHLNTLTTSIPANYPHYRLGAYRVWATGGEERLKEAGVSLLEWLDRLWPRTAAIRHARQRAAQFLTVVTEIASSDNRRLALAMALHRKLGARSAIGMLTAELVVMCVERSEPTAVITWDGVF